MLLHETILTRVFQTTTGDQGSNFRRTLYHLGNYSRRIEADRIIVASVTGMSEIARFSYFTAHVGQVRVVVNHIDYVDVGNAEYRFIYRRLKLS